MLVVASVFLMSEFSPTSFIGRDCSTFSRQRNPPCTDSHSTVTDLQAELNPNKAASVEIQDCVALKAPYSKLENSVILVTVIASKSHYLECGKQHIFFP